MKILTREIVSSSEMIKNYKTCREKAEILGKVFILKTNQPDAVLFSASRYEKFSKIIECLESLEEKDFEKAVDSLVEEVAKGNYILKIKI